MAETEAAARAVERGELVVYPTETVYGLGADARDPDAIRRVFETKGRSRSDPLSFAVPDLDTASEYVSLTPRERSFSEQFLPGPVTVVCERRSSLPDILTAGRDRVGLRIPDHPLALALLSKTPPLTATSANQSGAGSITTVNELAPSIKAAATVVLDGGTTAGTESTVVDVTTETIHRRGAQVDAVEHWLATH